MMTFSSLTFSSLTFATDSACGPKTVYVTIKIEIAEDGSVTVALVE